jgi:hypothetical protein
VWTGQQRKSSMGLQQQLDAFKAEFVRTAPVGRPALYDAKLEELRARFAPKSAIGRGDQSSPATAVSRSPP